MSSIDDKCVICEGSLITAVERPKSGYSVNGVVYRIDACSRCGAGVTMPRPSEAELERCYAQSYGYSTHELIEREKRRRSARILRWSGIARGRILDVGCMFGFLLDEGVRRGLDTHGVELSEAAAAVASSKGHVVTAGTIEELAETHPELRFDAIFAQHVLEHVPDPVSFLRATRRLLHPGGRLIACVPNFGARLRRLMPEAWGWYQVPFHLIHYTSPALHAVLGAAGYTVVDERTRGGDTLFLALSAAQLVGIEPRPAVAVGRPGLARAVLRAVGEVTRPYYDLGDDELAIIARA